MAVDPAYRDQWRATQELRWRVGVLQQQFVREVGKYSDYWKRTVYTPEHEWRDVRQATDEEEA